MTLAPPPLPLAREAQTRWAATPLRERLRVVRELRARLAENAEPLAAAAAAPRGRPLAEKLTAEVLPLADACRWLEREATRVLAPRRCGRRNRPLWLHGFRFEVQRQAFGVVLVIGPGNYPLFLPAVHALQALVAGNAVLLKPAPGGRDVALAFANLARAAGLDAGLLVVLPDRVDAAHDAIAAGVDKVIFTGSSANGRDLLAALAPTNVPAVLELSGEDVVIVLPDADADLVHRALRFGGRLNGGDTCIAARRLVVVEPFPAPLAPDLPVTRVATDAEAAALVNATPFALGATIFSRDEARARALAGQLRTGFVLINDLIVPTADPRLPFGGVRASGYGVTRGAEGLLEMTHPHVVAVRRGRLRPHLDPPAAGDATLFAAYIQAVHGRAGTRPNAFRRMLHGLLQRAKTS